MYPVDLGDGLFAMVGVVVTASSKNATTAVVAVLALICAYTTFHAAGLASFLKIFIDIFSTETIVFGLAVLLGKMELWPAAYAEYQLPDSVPLTVTIFSILVYAIARIQVVQQITRI